MKKSLLLITLLVISVSAFAAAPSFPDLPDLKLTIGTGLTPAFDLECFNTSVDKSTAWSVVNSFNSLESIAGSIVSQGGFGSATVGANTYSAANDGGTVQASNKVKWSTYRINKLPTVGLNVGDSITIDVGSQVSPISPLPASFGEAGGLIVSGPSVTAAWDVTSTKVTITLVSAAVSYVDVIAAPVATPAGDQDKERISIYPNLFGSASFAASSDTSTFGVEIAKGTGTKMSVSWAASATDAVGAASRGGVMILDAADGTQSYKGTSAGPHPELSVTYLPGQWYLSRMRYAASGASVANSQIQIWNFSNLVTGAVHVDVSTDILFGASSTWETIEAPLYCTASGSGYPQIQIKPNGQLQVKIDELQVINVAPTLIAAIRGCDKYGYAYGDFDVSSDTTQWGKEAYVAGQTQLNPTVSNGALQFTFASAAAVSGAKWTAGAPNTPLSVPVPTVGRQVGTVADVTCVTGPLTNLGSIFLSAIYGLPTISGSFADNGGQLVASAGFFGVTSGKKYAISTGRTPYFQFQFALKTNENATVTVDNVDFLNDVDDPNFGDGSLFP